jgi:hypothetical protein
MFKAMFLKTSYAAGIAALTFMQPLAPANAAVVAADWKMAGDGLVTRDVTNGREWLDLTQTTGLTVGQAIAQTGAGARLESWRLANMDELFSLYASAVGPVTPSSNGNTPISNFSPAELSSLRNLVDLIGVTFTLPGRNDSIGLIGHSAAQASEPNQAAGYFFYQLDGTGGFAWFNEGFTLPSYSDSSTGVYLIRNIAGNAVPEPASWMMMISGFGLLGAAARRHRRGTVPKNRIVSAAVGLRLSETR